MVNRWYRSSISPTYASPLCGPGVTWHTHSSIQVTVCGGKEAKGVVCESPSLSGSGESIFVTQLEDVPEVAESGGVRVAATVVLSPKGNFP